MVTLSESLYTSRRSILAGAFLTPARNIQLNSVVKKGTFELKYACHTFPDTKLCTAAILLPPAVVKSTSASANESASPAATAQSATSAKTPDGQSQSTAHTPVPAPVKQAFVYELVLCFKENMKAYYLVPRDAIMEAVNDGTIKFHFLTLRQADKSSPLQQQSITLELSGASAHVVAHLRSHVREQNEVRSKLASAIQHIEKMPVSTLDYEDPKKPRAKQIAITMYQGGTVGQESASDATNAKKASTRNLSSKQVGKRRAARFQAHDESEGQSTTKKGRPRKAKTNMSSDAPVAKTRATEFVGPADTPGEIVGKSADIIVGEASTA
jgi:hypothetical protein